MAVLLFCSLRSFISRAFIMLVLVSVANQGLTQTISSQDDLQLSGQVFLDSDYYGSFFSEDEKNSTSNAALRQAKVTVKYRPANNWKAKLQFKYFYEDSRNEEVEIGDATIAYTGFGWADITVGKMKEPFSLQRLTGLSDLIGIERSMVTSALSPGRSVGVQAGITNKRYTWSLGTFREKIGGDSDQSVTARATIAPVRNKRQTLHLGISASLRDHQNQRFQIKESGEVNTADNIIRSAKFDAEKSHLVGLEIAWQYRSLHIQSEFIVTEVEPIEGLDWGYSGYYIQSSFFLTGESRKYKNGNFKRVIPNTNTGAIEVIARYSELDIRDNGLGSESSIAMIGINYHWSKDIKLMANYLSPEISGNTLHDDGSGDAISVRLQLRF